MTLQDSESHRYETAAKAKEQELYTMNGRSASDTTGRDNYGWDQDEG